MYREIKYDDLKSSKVKGTYQLIDVRSPKEYSSETIPSSINLPIFSDEERAIIGREYKNGSVDEAKRIGVELVSKKLPKMYDRVLDMNKQYDNLIFFCARGGFRSKSLTSLFESLGIHALKLEGGYKGYRHFINENLPNILKDIKFIVLYGNSGTGKTEILRNLRVLGSDVLDLEACANHRGSLLGGVGLDTPNTQKMFESLVYDQLINRKSNLVFTEGESKRIGRIVMPEFLFKAITSGDFVKIEADINTRIDKIYHEYVNGRDMDYDLIDSLDLLRKYLGNMNIDRYIKMIKEDNYNPVIEELLLKYYDPLYEYNNREYVATYYNVDSMEIAHEIRNSLI